MDGEDVGLRDAARIDALLALDGGERGNAVAQPRRALEFELFRRLVHLARQHLAHRARFAGQEVARLARQFGIIVAPRLPPCRGRRSA